MCLNRARSSSWWESASQHKFHRHSGDHLRPHDWRALQTPSSHAGLTYEPDAQPLGFLNEQNTGLSEFYCATGIEMYASQQCLFDSRRLSNTSSWVRGPLIWSPVIRLLLHTSTNSLECPSLGRWGVRYKKLEWLRASDSVSGEKEDVTFWVETLSSKSVKISEGLWSLIT